MNAKKIKTPTRKKHVDLEGMSNTQRQNLYDQLVRELRNRKKKMYEELKPHLKKTYDKFYIGDKNNPIVSTLFDIVNPTENSRGIFLIGFQVGRHDDSATRRAGIGNTFLRIITDYAKDHNFDFIDLECFEDKIPFYKSAGFMVVAQRGKLAYRMALVLKNPKEYHKRLKQKYNDKYSKILI